MRKCQYDEQGFQASGRSAPLHALHPSGKLRILQRVLAEVVRGNVEGVPCGGARNQLRSVVHQTHMIGAGIPFGRKKASIRDASTLVSSLCDRWTTTGPLLKWATVRALFKKLHRRDAPLIGPRRLGDLLILISLR